MLTGIILGTLPKQTVIRLISLKSSLPVIHVSSSVSI